MLDNGCSNFSVHNNRVFDVDAGMKINPPNHNDDIENNDLSGSVWSVVSSSPMTSPGRYSRTTCSAASCSFLPPPPKSAICPPVTRRDLSPQERPCRACPERKRERVRIVTHNERGCRLSAARSHTRTTAGPGGRRVRRAAGDHLHDGCPGGWGRADIGFSHPRRGLRGSTHIRQQRGGRKKTALRRRKMPDPSGL